MKNDFKLNLSGKIEAHRVINGVFFSVLLAYIFAGSIFLITDNDVWWHLETGREIIQNLSIPKYDIFSYTIFKKPWVTFEWLSQVIFYSIYLFFGLVGLTIFKAFIAVAVFVLIKNLYKTKDSIVLWIVFALAFLAMRDGLRERPQIFSYLLTVLYIYILEKHSLKKYLVLPFLQILWANFHGASCFIGIGISSIYLIFDKDINFKIKIAAFLCILSASFINPHSYKIFTYIYIFFSGGFNKLILEYQHPVLAVAYLPYYVFILISCFSFVYSKNTEIKYIFLFCASLLSSFLAIRNIPIFCIVASIVSLKNFSSLNPVEKLKAKDTVLILILIFSISILLKDKTDASHKYRFGIGDNHKARIASEFIRHTEPRGPIFNDYDFGGYLIWRLYPKYRVFVDGRLLEYGRDFVEDSFYYWKPEIWDKLDKKYAFNTVIIANEGFYNACNIDALKNWILVYWDDTSLVYVRNIPEHKNIIRKFGYSYLCPNAPDQSYLKVCPPKAIAYELNRSCYYAPHSWKARRLYNGILSLDNKEQKK